MYQLERISVENSRDREQINRLVILTRSWPRRLEVEKLILSLSLSRLFVLRCALSNSIPPLLAGGKFCPGFGGELTRNNASSASRMLCQARNQVRPVMEIPGKFLSRLYPKINLDKAIGSTSFRSIISFQFCLLRNFSP